MHSTTEAPSPTRLEEEFSLPHATIYGGTNLYLDYLDSIGLRELLSRHIAIEKADYSTYQIEDTSLVLIIGHTLGKDRILQFEDLEKDPLLSEKLGLEKLPDYSLLYQELRQFDTPEKVDSIRLVNKELIDQVLNSQEEVILDFDSSVTTVYGGQERAERGYNFHKPGRNSYHPFFCFEGNSKLCLQARLRRGNASNAPDFSSFYQETKKVLPSATKIAYCRFDRAFAGEEVYAPLEEDGVGYVGKMRFTSRLRKHMRCFGFRRLSYGDTIVEGLSFNYQATTWDKRRRVVIIRTKEAHDKQLLLSDEFSWDYRVLVTNLDWQPEDIWRFYNQRCSSENYIKELKGGFSIDTFPTSDYLANAADMLFKVIAYNCYIAFKNDLCEYPFHSFTIERMRRYVLRIPAVIVRHARKLTLRLANNFRYQKAYFKMRRRLESAFT